MFTSKIKKSREFSLVFKTGKYLRLSSLIIQYKRKPIDEKSYTSSYGIVVSKKVGNAVKRNFAKRRLRAILNNIDFTFEKKPMNYVFIANKNLLRTKFSSLNIEICNALKKLTS